MLTIMQRKLMIYEFHRNIDMKGTFLGPEYSNYSIKEVLDFNKAVYKEFNDEALFEEVARLLSEGQCNMMDAR